MQMNGRISPPPKGRSLCKWQRESTLPGKDKEEIFEEIEACRLPNARENELRGNSWYPTLFVRCGERKGRVAQM